MACEGCHRGAEGGVPDLCVVLGEAVGADDLVSAGRPVEGADLRPRVNSLPVHVRRCGHVPEAEASVGGPASRDKAPACVGRPRDGLHRSLVGPKVRKWSAANVATTATTTAAASAAASAAAQAAYVPDSEPVVVAAAGEEEAVGRPPEAAHLLCMGPDDCCGGSGGSSGAGVVKVDGPALSPGSKDAAAIVVPGQDAEAALTGAAHDGCGWCWCRCCCCSCCCCCCCCCC